MAGAMATLMAAPALGWINIALLPLLLPLPLQCS